ncbi:hypothetical protein [Thiocapsa marina]|uniref:Glycoside hydrolase family 42 N-terminal domain-containing protein n=1 Tax=Thiocapsa marina 5811 TaxID=768671 RepID=F9UAP8_9GAMM|nr:hypothetical protein [Thiocapsa marina]EGV18516.1 hypothetical protein ThimaDRAFT_1934 [Thiocapsa marina 5811]
MKILFALRSLLYGVVCSTLVALPVHADQSVDKKWFPGHYVYANGVKGVAPIAPYMIEKAKDNPDFTGYHVRYKWRVLEPEKDVYDFSMIRQDIATAVRDGKKLIITILDRAHDADHGSPVPDYITTDPIYEGGIYKYAETQAGVAKYMPKYWVPSVAERVGKLAASIGDEFDDDQTLSYVNTEETALVGAQFQDGFSADALRDGYRTIHSIAVTGLKKTLFSQWVNWRGGLTEAGADEIMAALVAQGSGFGGPDALAVDRANLPDGTVGALDNAFGKYYTQYMGIAPITMSAQIPSMDVASPLESLNYAIDLLGAHFMTWNPGEGRAWSFDDTITMLRQEGARIKKTPPGSMVRLPPPTNLELHFE